MSRVVHFELGVDQPERASKFYSDVFGWNINKWDGPDEYWLISTGDKGQPGIDGGLMKREKGFESAATINTVDVSSVDEFSEKVTKSGGKIIVPKMPVPGQGYLAYCQDTEGNTFGIMQMDESAK